MGNPVGFSPDGSDVSKSDSGFGSDSVGVKLGGGVLFIIGLVLLIPFVRLIVWMFGHEYYQHMPLLMLVALGYGVYLARQVRMEVVGVISLRVLVWAILALGLAVGAFVIPSRWMAAPAALCLAIAAIYLVGGKPLARLLRGPLIIAIACIPLPVRFDSQFVVAMQQLATWLASIWLDWVGILHFATGVDIRTPGQNFIVEDACSGIHSMFAAITIGVIYGVFNRYSLFRLVAIVMQMVFWVVLANGGRVFAIVYAHDKWSYDLSSGLVHDFVGLVTFAVGVLLAFSGDHLWRYLFPVSRETIAELPFEERAEAGLIDRPVTVVAIAVVAVLLVVGMGTSLVFYSNFSRITAKRLTVAELALQSAINFEQTAEGILPEELAGWKRSGFKVMEQSPDSVFGGLRSFVWQFSNGSRQVILSIDGPYPGWHDLKVCYSATGWNVESELTEIEIGDNRVQLAKLVLERPPFERGFVLFGCVDKDKRCIAPPSFYGDSWGDWFGLRTRFGEDDVVAGGGGVVQLQLLDQTPIDLSNREIEENTQLFTAAYQHLFGAQPEAGE